MAHPQIINLTPASTSDQQRALEEVKDFALTDMDRGGCERWAYRILNEPALSEELARAAAPRTSPAGSVDSVSFQPCTNWHSRTQDRYRVDEWALPGGTWTYAAVFDGHMNHDCVDYVSTALGPHLRSLLDTALRARPPPAALPALVSTALRDAITHIDHTITADFLALFPKGPEAASRTDPAHARRVLNDRSTPARGGGSGGSGYTRTARAFGGTTALVSLVDPTRAHLWLANVGDCVAVLAEKDRAGGWRARVLTAVHNGSNPAELARIRAEHPAEPACVWNDRVLGFLAPTRALGDAWLKLPAAYAALVLANLDADWLAPDALAPHVPCIRTPPYLSSAPDVYHHDLGGAQQHKAAQRALVLCSDGLTDLYDGCTLQQMADEWAQIVGRALERRAGRTAGTNAALALLRAAVGGADTQAVSRNLTVEMEERWMDDTTVLVQRLP